MKRQQILPGGYPQRRGTSIAVLERRRKVRDLVLQGVFQEDIAVRLGVCEATITNDVKAIYAKWMDDDKAATKEKIARRVRQLELSAREAYNSFQASKNNVETVQTTYDRETCKTCEGTGRKGAKPCKVCEGTGIKLIENITRRQTGQAGDPSLLRVYVESIKEASRLQGLYAYIKARYAKKKDGQPVVNVMVGNGSIDWSRVPDEKILQIRYACAQALESSKALNVSSLPVEENG